MRQYPQNCLTVAICLWCWTASGEIRLPKIFADNMVLQREMPVAVWGWADDGEGVEVSFNGHSVSAKAGKDGRWRVNLPAMKADGKSHTLTVRGENEVVFKNILLGEVWIASGQSNMYRMAKVDGEHPNLRLAWRTQTEQGHFPWKDDFGDIVKMGWCSATPEALLATPKDIIRGREVERTQYGEVAYVFGRKIHEELGVPVGMIHTAVGGSQAQSWTPRADIEEEYPFGEKVEGTYLGHRPGLMYQGRIHPLVPMTIRGVIWYQGENDGRSRKYAEDFTKMIRSWRDVFERDDMPFYYVQIAQTTYASGMLGVYEAQQKVMETVPHTGIAVSNDIYDEVTSGSFVIRPDEKETGWPLAGGSNPHPPNKQLVANRLADIALEKTYEKSLGREIFGPMIESHKIEGDKILVKFKFVGKGLKSHDDKPLCWFEISDGTLDNRKLKYVQAEAKIVAPDTIEVHSPDVDSPKFVRFAWHSLARHNLDNSDGLPAFPFRTDQQVINGWR